MCLPESGCLARKVHGRIGLLGAAVYAVGAAGADLVFVGCHVWSLEPWWVGTIPLLPRLAPLRATLCPSRCTAAVDAAGLAKLPTVAGIDLASARWKRGRQGGVCDVALSSSWFEVIVAKHVARAAIALQGRILGSLVRVGATWAALAHTAVFGNG